MSSDRVFAQSKERKDTRGGSGLPWDILAARGDIIHWMVGAKGMLTVAARPQGDPAEAMAKRQAETPTETPRARLCPPSAKHLWRCFVLAEA